MENREKKASFIQALILAALVFFGFQFFFGHHQKKVEEAEKVSQKQTVSAPKDVIPSKEVGKVVSVDTPLYSAKISTVNGKLISLYIKKYRAQLVSDESKKTGIYPLMTVSQDKRLNEELSKLNLIPSAEKLTVKNGPQTLELRGKLLDGTTFIKKFTFYPNSYRIDVETVFPKGEVETVVGTDIKVNEAHTSRMGHIGPVVETEEKVFRLNPADITGFISYNNVLWAGEEDKYFLMAVKSNRFSAVVEKISPNHTFIRNFVSNATFYGGPKELNRLESLGMDSAIDFGVFGFLAKPFLKVFLFLHQFIPNWGLLIIIFTLIVKLILHPLTHKSFVSMKKMQEVAPKLEELKKRYGNDPQRLQEETMKLYKELGVNPASGCLPMIAQIPIFFALYEIFLNAVELKGAPFLWIKDLSMPDPTYALPILMGLSMIAQQLVTPTTNKQQQYMFIGMAVLFTFLFASFPAGLVLYWFSNNVITAIQNLIIKKLTEKA
jgi:YidC/Oxa1 family membrane protein insertase